MFTNSYCCFSVDSDMNGFFSRMLKLFCGFGLVFFFLLGIFLCFHALIVHRVLCSRCYHNYGTKKSVQKFFANKWKKIFTGITKVEMQRNRTVLVNKQLVSAHK